MLSTGETQITSNSAGTSGVTLAAGSGSWSSLSDRNMKENFAAVDGEDILQRLRSIPVSTWNYKTQDARVRHLGPMAQDFHAAFGVGEDSRRISGVDIDGVLLAAAQALEARTAMQQQRIDALQQENAELRERLERIEKLLLDDNQEK
ncbi:MAG TPA: tail fiber domain-containing protein [Thermoanaerobaculia bacterium]